MTSRPYSEDAPGVLKELEGNVERTVRVSMAGVRGEAGKAQRLLYCVLCNSGLLYVIS